MATTVTQRPIPPLRIIQPCATARLVSAVLGLPLETTYPMAGLKCCPACGTASEKPKYYPYCSYQCHLHENKYMTLICEECNQAFQRRTYLAVDGLVKKQFKHVWCSKHCQGLHLARTAGFAAHPENMHQTKKEYCLRGHLLAETRRTYASGQKHCYECVKIRRTGRAKRL